jgi:ABC-type transporter Mla subunit MlaD
MKRKRPNVTDRNADIKNRADEALGDEAKLAKVVEQLAVGSRRERQNAASVLHVVAKADAERLVPSVDQLIDALNRPEAQTRWEALEALTLIVPLDARSCSKAIPEAETSLFDEESGPVRLAAMRFLCKIGATTANRSDKVWPLIDEGIQCYHGDLEFNDMLIALIDFSTGKLSDDVKASFAERMKFDAENGKGTLQRRAQQITDNLK